VRRYLRPAYAVALSVVRNVAEGLPGLLAELGLTPEQAAKARAVVERHRAEFQAAVEESFPRVPEVQDRVDAEIHALPTPEQAARFDEIRRLRPPLRALGLHGPPPPEGRGRGVHPRVRRPRTRA
jgi:hypothetical protein